MPIDNPTTGTPTAPTRSTWGQFQTTPDRGMANYAGPDHVRDAATLVQRGTVFGLDYPLDAFVPSLATLRSAPEHHVVSRHRDHRDDYLDGFWPQAASHLDGLRHRRHAEHGFYNGTPDAAIVAGNPALGINHWSQHPIVGRGVLIDIGRHRTHLGKPIDHAGGEALDISELDDTLAAQDVQLRTGDLLLIRTGWHSGSSTRPPPTSARRSTPAKPHRPRPVAGRNRLVRRPPGRPAASDTFALERLPAIAIHPSEPTPTTA